METEDPTTFIDVGPHNSPEAYGEVHARTTLAHARGHWTQPENSFKPSRISDPSWISAGLL